MAGSANFKKCWLRFKLDGAAGGRELVDSSKYNSRPPSGTQPLANVAFSTEHVKFFGTSLKSVSLFTYSLGEHHPPICPVNSFTISLWVYPLAVGGAAKGIFSFDNRAGAFRLTEATGSKLSLVYIRDGGLTALTAATIGLTVNAWQHLAICWDGTTLRIFKDGVTAASTAVAASNSNLSICDNPQGNHRIGNDPISNNGMVGYYSDLVVYNDLALYTADFSPPTAPDVDYFRVINGTISESAAITLWKISAHDWHTGVLVGTTYSSGTTYKIKVATDRLCYVVLTPFNNILKDSPARYGLSGDILMPTDAPTNPHLWASSVTGAYVENTGATLTAPDAYTDYPGNTWNYVGPLVRPVCEGPLLPVDE